MTSSLLHVQLLGGPHDGHRMSLESQKPLGDRIDLPWTATQDDGSIKVSIHTYTPSRAVSASSWIWLHQGEA